MPERAQEIGGDHRRHHACDRQAHQYRRHDGEAEALEELTGDAGHKADRQEHRDDRHGRRQHRQPDFVSGVDRCLIGRFAHPHVPHDILDLDDRVVDQHAGDQAQGQERHAIERKAKQIEEPEGGYRRQRDRQRGNDRRAPVAQEHEHHDHRQERALDHRIDRGFVLFLGIFGVVFEQLEMNLRVLLLELLERLFRFVEHGHVGIILRAREIETDHRLAVDRR